MIEVIPIKRFLTHSMHFLLSIFCAKSNETDNLMKTDQFQSVKPNLA